MVDELAENPRGIKELEKVDPKQVALDGFRALEISDPRGENSVAEYREDDEIDLGKFPPGTVFGLTFIWSKEVVVKEGFLFDKTISSTEQMTYWFAKGGQTERGAELYDLWYESEEDLKKNTEESGSKLFLGKNPVLTRILAKSDSFKVKNTQQNLGYDLGMGDRQLRIQVYQPELKGVKSRELVERVEAPKVEHEKGTGGITFEGMLDKAAADLKEKGRYDVELSGQEFEGLARQVFDKFRETWKEDNNVDTTLESLDVNIGSGEGSISVTLEVKSPITARLTAEIGIKNSTEGGLETTTIKVNPARIMLLINTEARVAKFIGGRKINSEFKKVLGNQLRERGANLDRLMVEFTENNKLRIDFEGRPIK